MEALPDNRNQQVEHDDDKDGGRADVQYPDNRRLASVPSKTLDAVIDVVQHHPMEDPKGLPLGHLEFGVLDDVRYFN